MTLAVTIFTLYPDIYPGPLGASVIGKGLATEAWHLKVVNIRDYAEDKYGTVDGEPYGGGAGMVLRADVMHRALAAHYGLAQTAKGENRPIYPGTLLYLSPRGAPLLQKTSKRLAKEAQIGLVCGRFEGLDQRVIDYWGMTEVSLGDFILAGGDVAAMALVESVVRLLPDVLGSVESLEEESFQDDLLEYPLFTRPKEWAEMSVPAVLTSGHHENVRSWRRAEAEAITRTRRPDMWEQYNIALSKKKV